MSIDLVCGDPRGGGQADVREREAGGRAVISRPFPLTACFVLLLLGLHLQCQTPEILWPLAGCSFVKVDTKHNYNGWNVGVCWWAPFAPWFLRVLALSPSGMVNIWLPASWERTGKRAFTEPSSF